MSAIASSSQSSAIAGGPVLVACDGTAVSHEALFNAGRLAASAFGGVLEVIGVCEPVPGVAAGMDVLPVPAELDEARRATMLDDLRRAVRISAAGDPSWPIAVLTGSPARVLAGEAERRGASLIVMGIGRHNPLDRLFGLARVSIYTAAGQGADAEIVGIAKADAELLRERLVRAVVDDGV